MDNYYLYKLSNWFLSLAQLLWLGLLVLCRIKVVNVSIPLLFQISTFSFPSLSWMLAFGSSYIVSIMSSTFLLYLTFSNAVMWFFPQIKFYAKNFFQRILDFRIMVKKLLMYTMIHIIQMIKSSQNNSQKVETGLKLRPETYKFMNTMQGKLKWPNVSHYFRHH